MTDPRNMSWRQQVLFTDHLSVLMYDICSKTYEFLLSEA